jgi:hypothetical protein
MTAREWAILLDAAWPWLALTGAAGLGLGVLIGRGLYAAGERAREAVTGPWGRRPIREWEGRERWTL